MSRAAIRRRPAGAGLWRTSRGFDRKRSRVVSFVRPDRDHGGEDEQEKEGGLPAADVCECNK